MPPEEKRQTPQAPTPGSDEKSSLEARIRDLEAAMVAQRAAMPMSLTPLHGAGEGDEVAESWSLADQEAAQAEA